MKSWYEEQKTFLAKSHKNCCLRQERVSRVTANQPFLKNGQNVVKTSQWFDGR